MHQAVVIAVGDELLLGEVSESNSGWLSLRLAELGLRVLRHITVGDEKEQIVDALQWACGSADVVLITGGLGPTEDDLTRFALAELMNAELVLDACSLQRIVEFFGHHGVRMPQRNRIQAMLPAGAEPLPNRLGTAPGIAARIGRAQVFALPGVPEEMRQMFEHCVRERLGGIAGGECVVVRRLQCFGAGESTIAERLGELMARGRNPTVNTTVAGGIVTVHIVAHAGSAGDAARMLDDYESRLRRRLGRLVFGRDEQTLQDVVAGLLLDAGKTVAVAESCTAGGLAHALTSVPGSSAYFIEGIACYSNESKVRLLGVPSELIRQHGAVSREVAEAMAVGARRNGRTDFALAVTGIAGPSGGTAEKPVGLVYLALAREGGCRTRREIFPGSRRAVRRRAVLTALNMLRLELLEG